MAIETRQELVNAVARMVQHWSMRRASQPLAAVEGAWPMSNYDTEDFARLLEGLEKARLSSEVVEQERSELDEVIGILERWIYRC